MIQEAHEAALETRGERDLEEALGNPARGAQVERYVSARIGIQNEDEENAAANDLATAQGEAEPDAIGLGDYDGQITDPLLEGGMDGPSPSEF
jgi:hypothetical protein